MMSSAPNLPSRDLPTPRALVLGLGNSLLTDDSIGLRVVAGLQERLENSGYIFRQSDEAGLALLDLVTGFDEAVIIDAVKTGEKAPGEIYELAEHELSLVPAVSPHFFGIAEMLSLGRALGLKVPRRLKVFAIEVEDVTTIGQGLTDRLKSSLPEIVDRVARSLRILRPGLPSRQAPPAQPQHQELPPL